MADKATLCELHGMDSICSRTIELTARIAEMERELTDNTTYRETHERACCIRLRKARAEVEHIRGCVDLYSDCNRDCQLKQELRRKRLNR